ncbi:helix-turn-helix domain-containing protein, partial [Aggregatibacter actinomycetemcomitans]
MKNEELTKQRISERLEFVIEDSNLKTRKALAELVGVKAQSVTNWIQRGQISQDNARIINLKLGYPIDWLLGGDVSIDKSDTPAIEGDLIQSEQSTRHRHRIDYYDVRAAAGMSGFENSDYPEIISSLFLTDEGMLQLVGK